MTKGLLEIILTPDVQKVFDDFSAAFGIRIAFFSLDGKEVKAGLKKPISSFCTHIQKLAGKRDMCIASDRKRMQEAFKRMDIVVYTCHAGLIEAIVPIILTGCCIGYIMIGQIRRTQKLSKTLAGNAGKNLINAYHALPIISDKQLQSVISLLRITVDHIIGRNLIQVKRNMLAEKVHQYITGNLEKPVTLSDAARHVGRSNTTVTHIFKSVFGKSFKNVLLEMKIEKAKKELIANPGLSVEEAAYKLGFADQFYFSRIFKKYAGHSPRHFRKIISTF